MPIRVSYIVTTRNRAGYLDRTLQNIREFLDPEQDELLLMDGASTDDTAKVVEKHRDIVTVFRSEPDCGEAHGFNKGLLLARGEILKVLTDDDYIYPNAMRQAIATLASHPEVDCMACGGELTESDPATNEERIVGYGWLPPSMRLLPDIVSVSYVKCGVGLFLRKRVLSRVGLFDTQYMCIDTEYFSRLIQCGVNFRYLDIKLYRHITWPHSIIRREAEAMADSIRIQVRAGHWDRIMDSQRFPRSAVAAVLGLGRLPGGELLMDIIWHADRIRKTRRPIVLRLLGGMVRVFVSVLGGYSVVRRAFRGPQKITEEVAGGLSVGPTVEPAWDGTLR